MASLRFVLPAGSCSQVASHFFQTTHTVMLSCSLSSKLSCWKCGKEIPLPEQRPLFFCPCTERVVLPPTTRNYFTVMSCPVSYKVDITILKKMYKTLQRELHPDKFTIKSLEEKELSAEQSSLVNKAYSTLLSPYTRGLYLLELNGLSIDEKDNTAGSDLEFLEEVMSLNEELQELEINPDPVRLKLLRDSSQSKLTEHSKELGLQFEQGDYSTAKKLLGRMKYFVNINEQIKYLLPLENF